jgi:hypothetical protein
MFLQGKIEKETDLAKMIEQNRIKKAKQLEKKEEELLLAVA